MRASGATGPGILGVLHWQAAHVAQPLRGWTDEERVGPLAAAAGAGAWAVTLMLDSMGVMDPDDLRTEQLLATLDEAREQLITASAHLERVTDQAIDLASELASVIAAAGDDIAGNGGR